MSARRECRAHYAGCIMLASSGGVALVSLLADDAAVPVLYSIVLLGLGLTVYKLETLADSLVSMIVAVAVIATSIIMPRSLAGLALGLTLSYAGLAWLMARSGSLEVVLSYWPIVSVPAYAYGGLGWMGVFSSSIILLSSVLAYLEGGRGHALMITAVSPIALMVNPLVSLAAAASTLALAGVLAGIVERSGCPFTQDSGLVFIGVALSIIGVLMGIFTGPWTAYWLIVWLTGFLYIEAGALVPQGIHRKPSS